MKIRRARAWLPACAGLLMATAHADPWLAPGDEGLRCDIELLADAGILRGPVTTWPISWPDLARDALALLVRGRSRTLGRVGTTVADGVA